jgi:hypothetical protein
MPCSADADEDDLVEARSEDRPSGPAKIGASASGTRSRHPGSNGTTRPIDPTVRAGPPRIAAQRSLGSPARAPARVAEEAGAPLGEAADERRTGRVPKSKAYVRAPS